MSARTFHRLSNRLFAIRAAWNRQVPVRVEVAGDAATAIDIIPIVTGKAPALVTAPAPAAGRDRPCDIAA